MKSKIVVIEDDEGVRDIITAYFKPKGFEVKTYFNAESVIEDIENHTIEGDVFVIDLWLPNMSGIELIKKMKQAKIEAPIISITAHNNVETAIEAIDVGAYDFFIKPLYFPQLLISIQRALRLQKSKTPSFLPRDLLTADPESDGMICVSPAFKKVLELAKRVANSSASVYISGESGVGKEVVARAIHNWGGRKKAPFVAINCSAIPENLLESELFGHAKGSFTGAAESKTGLFEAAAGGTFLLDEISDLSAPLQAKLLRVLQERKIKRVGENQLRNINVRILSATHHNLKKQVEDGQFREDLYFRLNVIPIYIPPLRERREDILPLAEFFLQKYAALNNSKVSILSPEAIEKLIHHQWKGNVRELENVIERAVVLSTDNTIKAEDLFSIEEHLITQSERPLLNEHIQVYRDKILPINEVVNMYIKNVLDKNAGAKEKTAKDLGIDRKTLYRKLNEIYKHPSAPMT